MEAHAPRAPLVVKVGGSLFDLPDFGTRLRRFLAELGNADVLLVPGGGPAADVIRALDATHQLGEEASHWLALRALTLNAHFLRTLLPEYVVTAMLTGDWPRKIVDMHAFARGDEARPDRLPHRWHVTSDSLALRVAQVTQARELVLLKSVPWEGDMESAARAGHVDAAFVETLRRHPVPVRWRCLRTE